MNGDPRLRPQGYFDNETEIERAEYLERLAEHRAERQRDDEQHDDKIGNALCAEIARALNL